MASRYKLSPKKSRKIFKKGYKTNQINKLRVRRGGGRL